MQRRYHRKEESHKQDISLKPIAIGALLIIIVIGFYLAKHFILTKNKEKEITSSEKITEQEETKELSVPMILGEDLQKNIRKETYQIIDIRNSDDFKNSHIEQSKNIPIDSLRKQSNILDKNKSLVIVDETETIQGKEATQYLNEAGFSAKYLVGGISKFAEEGYSVISFGDPNSLMDIAKVKPISSEQAIEKLTQEAGSIKFLDVRSKRDFEEYSIKESINIPLEEIEERKNDIPTGRLIIVDEDPIRSFQAAVRLDDMNFIGVYCLKSSLSDFKSYVEGGNSESEEDGKKEEGVSQEDAPQE